MKQLIGAIAVLLACISGEAFAQCSTLSQVTGLPLQQLVAGSTVCAIRGAERWQEEHRGVAPGGQLWDYKRGPTNPVDPTKHVGAWRIAGDNVSYAYLGGSPIFTYTVHANGGTYNFCTGGAPIVTGATFIPGTGVGCGFPP